MTFFTWPYKNLEFRRHRKWSLNRQSQCKHTWQNVTEHSTCSDGSRFFSLKGIRLLIVNEHEIEIGSEQYRNSNITKSSSNSYPFKQNTDLHLFLWKYFYPWNNSDYDLNRSFGRINFASISSKFTLTEHFLQTFPEQGNIWVVDEEIQGRI